MATLVNCLTGFAREMMERAIFHGTRPFWEEITGGTPFQWNFTTFYFGLHKTADPGEGGDLTTNVADYTGYAGAVAYPRGAAYWDIVSASTDAPGARISQPVVWGKNTGASQDIVAASIAMRDGVTDYEICRDVYAAPVAIATNKTPVYSGGDFEVRLR